MWWNFVARTRDEMEVAYRDWQAHARAVRHGAQRPRPHRRAASPVDARTGARGLRRAGPQASSDRDGSGSAELEARPACSWRGSSRWPSPCGCSIAVVVPTTQDLPCSGVQFRAPVKTTPSADVVPPIGGAGGFAGHVRSLFIRRGAGRVLPRLRRPLRAPHRAARTTRTPPTPSTTTSRSSPRAGCSAPRRRIGRAAEAAGVVGPRLRLGAGPARPPGWLRPLLHDARPEHRPRVHLVRARNAADKARSSTHTSGPLICPAGGGAIDPNPFVDATGTAYLLWKNYDGFTGIMGQPLAADGRSLVGTRAAHAPGRPAVGARHRRGPHDARGAGRALLPLLLGQRLGRRRTTRSATRSAHRRSDRA